MQKRLIIAALLAGVIIISPVASAQTPTPAQVILNAEAERERTISRELSLNLPETSDDPNYPVTFVDPSSKGVEIAIGTQITQNAPSPFILPNLPIGAHTVTFKFTNKEGLVRVLSKQLIIVPKPPIFDQTIKTEVVRPNQVVLSGTALPQSTVMVIVNSSTVNKFSSNQDGKWEFILPEPVEGKNTIIAFVLRNGLISEASKPLTVEYKLFSAEVNPQVQVQEAQNQITQIVERIKTFTQTNPNEFYAIIGGALFIIIILVAVSIRRKMDKKREEKSIADIFGGMSSQKTILDIVSEESNSKGKVVKKKVKAKEKTKPAAKEEKKEKEQIKPALSAKEVATEQKIAEALPNFQKRKVDISSKRVSSETVKKAKKTTKKVKASVITKSTAAQKLKPADTNKSGDSPEAEEPAKKILSKEEFLKQFQTKNEKNDK
ncbi:MAG: hypothetical protein QY314_04185 [Candidatus Dojkabacteria bacterium]|nr:MAG: hypothetical protein QY314_04185 [Candidatus Dojkabacteria bacterium]